MRRFLVPCFLAVLLLPACGGGGGGGGDEDDRPRVLMLQTADAAAIADTQARLQSSGHFSDVAVMDLRSRTPTLGELQAYHAVVLIFFESPQDRTQLGNALADYVDGGGGVVDTATSLVLSPPLGRWRDEGFRLMTSDALTSQNNTPGIVANVFDHPTLAGISDFQPASCYTLRDPVIAAGVTGVARWDNPDGWPTILVDESKAGRRVGLGFVAWTREHHGYGVSSTGDAMDVVANACLWAAGGS